MKPILDACCGGRMFYFDKNNPNVLFADIRNQKLSFKDRDKIRHLGIRVKIDILQLTQMLYTISWICPIRTNHLSA